MPFWVLLCRCEQSPDCGGFALDYSGLNEECWYLLDTRVYVEESNRESCYTYRINSTAIDVSAEVGLSAVCVLVFNAVFVHLTATALSLQVAKCTQCNSDTSFADCMSLVDNAYNLSWDRSYSGNFCNDLQTAVDCATAGSTEFPDGYLQVCLEDMQQVVVLDGRLCIVQDLISSALLVWLDNDVEVLL